MLKIGKRDENIYFNIVRIEQQQDTQVYDTSLEKQDRPDQAVNHRPPSGKGKPKGRNKIMIRWP
jgi:hypothetical protein